MTCIINASDNEVSIPEGSVIRSSVDAESRVPALDSVRKVYSVADPY